MEGRREGGMSGDCMAISEAVVLSRSYLEGVLPLRRHLDAHEALGKATLECQGDIAVIKIVEGGREGGRGEGSG